MIIDNAVAGITEPVAEPVAEPAPDAAGGSAMNATERRAAWSLTLIYIVRMMGLFLILPVFTLFAGDYVGSTPLLVGLAIGIYGLMQAALQIPFGMLSDRIGRKPVITAGLLLMFIGSVVAALADHIAVVIVGRALQGAGAVAAALMALAADLTRDEQRTKVMAMLGASIGFAFILALIVAPSLLTWFSIDGLFWLTAACAAVALALLYLAVPNPVRCHFNADTGANLSTMKRLLTHRELLRLDGSIFMLHLLVTAIFFALPLALLDAGIEQTSQWKIYLPTVLVSVAIMVPLAMIAEKRAMRGVLLACIGVLALLQLYFGFAGAGLVVMLVGITLFFGVFNTLEALLPSLVSRMAPAASKGSAMGIYSSSQFFGAFVGGTGAGWLYGSFGPAALFTVLAALCFLWLLAVSGFTPPRKLTTLRRALNEHERAQPDQTLERLSAMPGVEEVVIAIDEGVAYIKVERHVFAQAEGAS